MNKRNAEQVACTAIQEYAKLIQEGNCYQGYRIWDSSCGHTRARGSQDVKVKHIIPTVHGYHLITIGFDTNQFAQQLAIRNLDSIDTGN